MTKLPDTCWIIPEFRRPQGGFEQKKSRKNRFLTLGACTPRRKRSYTMICKITQDLHSGKRIFPKSQEKMNKDFQFSNRGENICVWIRHFWKVTKNGRLSRVIDVHSSHITYARRTNHDEENPAPLGCRRLSESSKHWSYLFGASD